MDYLIWIFIIMTLPLMIANYVRVHDNVEGELRKWAQSSGFRVILFELTTEKYNSLFGEAQVLVCDSDDREIPGRLTWKYGNFGPMNIEFFPARSISNAERRAHTPDANLDEELLATLYIDDDREAQILNEVNSRLDRITSQPGWMEPYDLDGSGHVDEKEWSILRGNIMAEVRGDLGDPGVRSVSTPAQDHAGERLPAPVVHDDDDENLW